MEDSPHHDVVRDQFVTGDPQEARCGPPTTVPGSPLRGRSENSPRRRCDAEAIDAGPTVLG